MHRSFWVLFCQMNLVLCIGRCVQAISVRQIIFEKELSDQTVQRVALVGDEHEFGQGYLKEVVDKQSDAIYTSFHDVLVKDPSAELYLEAADKHYSKLDDQLSNIVITGDSYPVPSLKQVKKKRKNCNEELLKKVTASVPLQLGLHNRLLQKLSLKFFDVDQVKFLDTRSFFSTLINMIDRVLSAVVIKDFPKGDYFLSSLSTSDVTVHDVLKVMDELIKHGKDDIERLLPKIHDQKITSYMKNLSKGLDDKARVIEKLRRSFDMNKLFFRDLEERASNALASLGAGDMAMYLNRANVRDFIEFWQFYKNVGHEELDLFDISLLANLFASRAKHVVIIAGIVHMKVLKKILQSQGYKLVYDSHFRVRGHLIHDDMEYAVLKILKPELFAQDESSVLYDPLLESEFGYVVLDGDELKEKERLENLRYKSADIPDYMLDIFQSESLVH